MPCAPLHLTGEPPRNSRLAIRINSGEKGEGGTKKGGGVGRGRESISARESVCAARLVGAREVHVDHDAVALLALGRAAQKNTQREQATNRRRHNVPSGE
eukprot:6204747-Pleurochrysis_carterae.AAC.5